MGSHHNGVVHGRLSKVLNTLRDIAQAVAASDLVVVQETRVESLICAIESSAAELYELYVGKMDKNTSEDSGNTSFTEVGSVVYKLTLYYQALDMRVKKLDFGNIIV